MTLIIVTRDMIIVFGSALIYVVRQNLVLLPTRWGKFATMFQMASVVSVLLQWQISYLFWSGAVFFTIVSGIDYVRKGLGVLYAVDNSRPTG